MHVTDLKLYIAVHDEVPDHMVPVLVAHSMLGAHLLFESYFAYRDWLKYSFKKVVLRVNQKEFDKIVKIDQIYLGHENTTMNGERSCIVLMPRSEYPNVIKFAKMWSPK